MSAPAKRQQVFPPAKGSFPIDHFQECNESYDDYMKCLKDNLNQASKCREATKNYLECRMKNNLMQREKLENLGLAKTTPNKAERL